MPPLSDADVALVRERLTRVVARICPSWLSARRDDIVQLSVMRLLDRLALSEEIGPVGSSYMWKVAFSVTVDEIRSARRRRETSIEADPGQDWPSAEADPERLMQLRQMGLAIRECLQGLSTARRLAVTSRLIGHTARETGRLLGWSAKRVQNLVYRGLEDLRNCLGTKGVNA